MKLDLEAIYAARKAGAHKQDNVAAASQAKPGKLAAAKVFSREAADFIYARRMVAISPGMTLDEALAVRASAYSTPFGHTFHADSATYSRVIRPGGRSEATLGF